jgi:pimeloyl-ACP methyl ester carboxylesterase
VHRSNGADHRVTERRLTVSHGGVKLAVRDLGGQGGRDLLFLHGLASSSHMIDLAALSLIEEFHVVAYDQRGHGESSKPSSGYGFESMTGDAAAVIRELDLERPVALGHSWGANVALELGVRHPEMVSALILLDGGFMSMRDGMDWKTTKEMLAPPPISGMHIDEYLSMMRGFMSDQLEVTPEVESVFRSLMRVDSQGRIRPRLSRANHLKILHALWGQDAPALLARLRVPTLILATRRPDPGPGDEGFIAAKQIGEQQVREIGGHIRFEWIEGIHDVPLQHPDEVARRVHAFAASL